MTGSIIKKHQPSKERHHPQPDPSDKLSSPSIKKDVAAAATMTMTSMKTRRGPGRPPKTVVIAADKEDKVKTVVVVAKRPNKAATAKVAVARRCSSPSPSPSLPDIRLNSISELTGGGRPSACEDRYRAVFDLIKKLRMLEIETVEVNKRLSDEREAVRIILNKFIEE
jgi:hypothetical protein